jgi:hypothetical protein
MKFHTKSLETSTEYHSDIGSGEISNVGVASVGPMHGQILRGGAQPWDVVMHLPCGV